MPWKFAVAHSLALFVAVLAVAPFLIPTRGKVAARFNDQTFKAAAAIKVSAKQPLRPSPNFWQAWRIACSLTPPTGADASADQLAVARSLALALPGKAAVVARDAAFLSARLELRGQSNGVASMARLSRSASRM